MHSPESPTTNPAVAVHNIGATATISVITAVYEPNPVHFNQAYESVMTQDLPPGWKLEWLLQEDGKTGRLEDLFDDPRVRVGMASHSDTATARNLALARSKGELVKTFDQDDILTPGALARDIKTFQSNPRVQWACSLALDLLPDGTTSTPKMHITPGVVARDTVFNTWEERDHCLPLHPATSCYQRNAIMALGGWMAVRHAGDTGLLLAASTLWEGYFEAIPGLLWRRTPEQTSSQPTHNDAEEKRNRINLFTERVGALRNFR